MKPMMESRYVGWMAMRPLTFGDEEFAPGDRIPQKHLDAMRDPEVLVRTRRIAAVAKDMNKVPRMLRKDVTDESEMRERILAPRIASQIGEIKSNAVIKMEKKGTLPERDEPRGVGGSGPGYNPDAAANETDVEPIPYPSPAVPSIAVADPLNTTGGPDEDVVVAETDTKVDTEVDKEAPELDETAGQEPAETDTTGDTVTAEIAPGTTVNPVQEPAKNAATEDWVTFAKGSGASDEDLDGMNRAELIAKYATAEIPEES